MIVSSFLHCVLFFRITQYIRDTHNAHTLISMNTCSQTLPLGASSNTGLQIAKWPVARRLARKHEILVRPKHDMARLSPCPAGTTRIPCLGLGHHPSTVGRPTQHEIDRSARYWPAFPSLVYKLETLSSSHTHSLSPTQSLPVESLPPPPALPRSTLRALPIAARLLSSPPADAYLEVHLGH
jgi:hypothetical protein